VARRLSGLLLALLLSMPLAAQTAPPAPDPALEARVKRLTEELRCLVCQNQTIADSQVQLAVDLKNQVREQLERGASDQQVSDYMVQRYGDFVLYRPPLKGSTLLLWFGPFAMLLAGLGLLWARLRRQGLRPADRSTDQHAGHEGDLA